MWRASTSMQVGLQQQQENLQQEWQERESLQQEIVNPSSHSFAFLSLYFSLCSVLHFPRLSACLFPCFSLCLVLRSPPCGSHHHHQTCLVSPIQFEDSLKPCSHASHAL